MRLGHPPDDFLCRPFEQRIAGRAPGRHHERLWLVLSGGSQGDDRLDDLRNDIAALLDKHHIPSADVFPCDLLGVVERRHLDSRPGQTDRFENGIGRDRTGAADVDLDADQLCRGLLSRVFEGDGPPGKLRRCPETDSERRLGRLDDNSIGIESECPPRVTPLVAKSHHLVDAGADLPMRLDRETPPAEALQASGRAWPSQLSTLHPLQRRQLDT